MHFRAVVPAASFPSSSSLYNRLFVAREFLRQRAAGVELSRSQETEGIRGILESKAYQKILQYPGELWPGEHDESRFPPVAEFDWGHLSQQPVPGFEVQPLPPWMQPADPSQAEIAPSYVHVRDASMLLNAAWFSSPCAFRSTGQAEQAASEWAEADASLPRLPDIHEVAEQTQVGKVPRLPVKLFSPAVDPRTKRPLNPILFVGCRLDGAAELGSSQHCASAPAFPRFHVRGRGVLGRWGPNHAADALLTARNPENGKLQVALIRRTDGSGRFAMPGGFVDPTDGPFIVTPTVREFLEEAVSYEEDADTADSQRLYEETLSALRNVFGFFSRDKSTGAIVWESEQAIKWGNLIYAGYVDDERNTENAWMETIILHWHVSAQDYARLHLQAGDDASLGSAAFYDIDGDPHLVALGVDPLKDLYASHSAFLVKVIEQHFPDEAYLLAKAA
ncbi:nudix -type motif 9 isoform a family protein [Besnoitia besnoiti]|uniref:Nudix-type motif 9 isoform a family protein n=1 Tax=Besnoitia besnoiti TaxID=94643 RepID=A0A2A9MLU5_BESBE|nr:nudix -type motif 9 isoform a family protein [Besnoitia besnoiti]PFH38254.1 nudix -type motif 9 isoform a family protein [Besnoitia besnoiti]